ncbi:MAG: hypothetical protein U1U88_000517 [Lawsonella clevelandensis]
MEGKDYVMQEGDVVDSASMCSEHFVERVVNYIKQLGCCHE